MNKELIDRAWRVLPAEFKEVVQEEYAIISKELSHRDTDAEDYIAWNYAKMTFEELFGSKCLPDEEPKPAEPKFMCGDKAVLKGYVCTIRGIVFGPQGKLVGYKIESSQIHGNMTVPESRLEPYTEPEEDLIPSNSGELNTQEADNQSRNLSQETANCDKQLENILKDSFRNERRLNIAVQLLCAIIPKYQDNGDGIGLSVLNEKDMIKCAYRLADALIAEAEKRNSYV